VCEERRNERRVLSEATPAHMCEQRRRRKELASGVPSEVRPANTFGSKRRAQEVSSR